MNALRIAGSALRRVWAAFIRFWNIPPLGDAAPRKFTTYHV
jgi:hypothetical protein